MSTIRAAALLATLGLLTGCPGEPYDTDDDSASQDDDVSDDDATGDDDTSADDDSGDDDTMADDDTGDDDTSEGASEYMYAQTSDELYAVDKDSPYTVTHVGTFDQTNITDLAVDMDGRMFAVTYDTVFEVDPDTAQLTALGTMLDGSFFALTGLSDGRLLAGSDNAIYEVDVVTGDISWFDSLGDWEFAGDMVGLPDGLLYCLVWPTDVWAESTSLVVYDPATGITSEIGLTGHGSMFGMGFADWTMFGFNTDGEILEIDFTTGAAQVISTPGYEFWGAATNPLRWD